MDPFVNVSNIIFIDNRNFFNELFIFTYYCYIASFRILVNLLASEREK